MFVFDENEGATTLAPDQSETTGARIYLARVACEDGAALSGRAASIRRGLWRLVGACSDDLTAGLQRVNPAASAEVSAELEALLAGAQRLGEAVHALEVAAQRAHWAAIEYAPAMHAEELRDADVPPREFEEEAPELDEGEYSRDADAPDVEAAPAPAMPAQAARAAVVPAIAEQPKIPVTAEANRLRKQFWAVVNKQGLSSKADKATRKARLDAISKRLGREVISINTLTLDEWQDVISGVEYGSLEW